MLALFCRYNTYNSGVNIVGCDPRNNGMVSTITCYGNIITGSIATAYSNWGLLINSKWTIISQLVSLSLCSQHPTHDGDGQGGPATGANWADYTQAHLVQW